MTEEQADEIIGLLRDIHLELIKISGSANRLEMQQLKTVEATGKIEDAVKRMAPR